MHTPDLNYLKTPLKTLFFAASKSKGRLLVMCLFIVSGNVFSASLPYFFKIIVNRVVEASGVISFQELSRPLGFVVAVLLLAEISWRIAHVLETYIAPDVFRHITTSLYEGLIRRPSSYFEDKFSGDLGRRIEQIGIGSVYFIDDFPWHIGWIIVSVAVSGILFWATHLYILLTFIIWFIFFFGISIPLLMWHHRTSEKVASSYANLSGRVIDTLSNISLVHSFGGTSYEEKLNRKFLDTLVSDERKMRWTLVVNKFQQGMSTVLLGSSLTFVSIYLFARGGFSAGDFVVVTSTILTLIGVIWNFGDGVLRASQKFGQLSDAVLHLRDRQEQLSGGATNVIKGDTHAVNFDRVFFQYPATEHPVFQNFTLRIDAGEHVGLVGPSGVGKSTLIKLLLRQYEPGAGEVMIGTTPTRKLTLQVFNSLISYVPQDTTLFHRTLFENIHYAKPTATREAVVEASRRAYAHELIEELPEKYETKVGERGIKLSGGQRQRIALARAILKNAPILVLDEATSSLDSESEQAVQRALSDLFEGRTVIAIAHRLSTLRAMDRIVVIDNGTIVESGSPQELLNQQESVFKKMWEHQKNGFI